MTAITLHLLRHGPPLRTGLMLGHCDVPAAPGAHDVLLNRVKDLQAPDSQAPDLQAPDLQAACVVTSDLARAQDGAQLLARAHALPLRIDRRWRELDFGAWDGLSAAEIDQQDLHNFWSDPDTYPPPGGERWHDLAERIGAAIAAIDQTSLIVCHAGAMRAAISVLTGLNHRGVWAVDLPYGALLSIRLWRGDGDTPPSGQITGLHT